MTGTIENRGYNEPVNKDSGRSFLEAVKDSLRTITEHPRVVGGLVLAALAIEPAVQQMIQR